MGKSKIEYQVVIGNGDDVLYYGTLREARKEYNTNQRATELRKVIWREVRLSVAPTFSNDNLDRREIILAEREREEL